MAPRPYDDGPTHPGPAPVEPIFPFAEAEAALTAIGTLLDQLMALSTTRDAAASTMLATSSGQSIDAFEARNDDLSTELRNTWSTQGSGLVMDQEWLRDAIEAAHTAHDQWVTDKAAWQTQLDWHDEWTRTHPGVPADQGPR